MNELNEVYVHLFNDVYGTGYNDGFFTYISVKEIGRKLNYKDSALKDFTKWVIKNKELKPFVTIKSLKNKSGATNGHVILTENLPYVIDKFIERTNNQRISLEPVQPLIHSILSFKPNYISIESFTGYLSKERFIEIFKQQPHNCKHIPDKITYSDFIIYLMERNLYHSYYFEVTEIMREFAYLDSLSSEIISTLCNHLIPPKERSNNATFL